MILIVSSAALKRKIPAIFKKYIHIEWSFTVHPRAQHGLL